MSSGGTTSVPSPHAGHSPKNRHSHQMSSDRDSDYDVPLTKGERLRKEKMLSMLAAKRRQSGDSSSDPSRPVSVNSSVYSADSGSLTSSPSGSKVTLPSREESTLDHDLEMIDKLVADVALQNSSMVQGPSGRARDETSSHSSNDNLGVWDDVNIDEDSDEVVEGE